MAIFSIRAVSSKCNDDGKKNAPSIQGETCMEQMEQTEQTDKESHMARAEIFLDILVRQFGISPEIKNNLNQKKLFTEKGIEIDLPDEFFSVKGCDKNNWRKKGLYFNDQLIASGVLGETTQLDFAALANVSGVAQNIRNSSSSSSRRSAVGLFAVNNSLEAENSADDWCIDEYEYDASLVI